MMSNSKGLDLGYAVVQVDKSLSYTRARFQMGLLEFFIDLIISDSPSGISCEGKGGRKLRLIRLPPVCIECLEIQDISTS